MIQVASTNWVSASGIIGADLARSDSTLTGPPLSRALALPSAVPSIRKQTPSSTRSLIATLARDGGAVLGDANLVAVLQLQALGVGQRQLNPLFRLRNFSGGFSSVIGPAHRSR